MRNIERKAKIVTTAAIAMWACGVLFNIAAVVGIIWVAWHFISKYW